MLDLRPALLLELHILQLDLRDLLCFYLSASLLRYSDSISRFSWNSLCLFPRLSFLRFVILAFLRELVFAVKPRLRYFLLFGHALFFGLAVFSLLLSRFFPRAGFFSLFKFDTLGLGFSLQPFLVQLGLTPELFLFMKFFDFFTGSRPDGRLRFSRPFWVFIPIEGFFGEVILI